MFNVRIKVGDKWHTPIKVITNQFDERYLFFEGSEIVIKPKVYTEGSRSLIKALEIGVKDHNVKSEKEFWVEDHQVVTRTNTMWLEKPIDITEGTEIRSKPPYGLKRVRNIYWDGNTNEFVYDIEE